MRSRGIDAERGGHLRRRGFGAAGAVGPRHEVIAAQTGLAHHVLEGDVGGARHRDSERAAGGAVGVAGGVEQHRQIGALHHLVLVALVEHREARRHIGLERKLLQQPRAQRVDGLHLQAARRFQRAGEQFAGAQPQFWRRDAAMPASRIAASSAASSSVTQWPSVENTRSAMLAAAALVKVMQRIFSGGTPFEQQPDHPLHQHMGLARTGIGRDEGRGRRDRRRAPAWRGRRRESVRGAFTIPRSPSRRPPTIP